MKPLGRVEWIVSYSMKLTGIDRDALRSLKQGARLCFSWSEYHGSAACPPRYGQMVVDRVSVHESGVMAIVFTMHDIHEMVPAACEMDYVYDVSAVTDKPIAPTNALPVGAIRCGCGEIYTGNNSKCGRCMVEDLEMATTVGEINKANTTYRIGGHDIKIKSDLTMPPGTMRIGPHSFDCGTSDYGSILKKSYQKPTLSAQLGHLKHGPLGSGLGGPCDADCAKCKVEAVTYDGVTLHDVGPCDADCAKCAVEARNKAAVEFLAKPFQRLNQVASEPIAQWDRAMAKIDPLDVMYDEVTLRELLIMHDRAMRDQPSRFRIRWHQPDGKTGLGDVFDDREACQWAVDRLTADITDMRYSVQPLTLTPTQRAAVSAHWSAELRAKVAATTKADRNRERNRVTYCEED